MVKMQKLSAETIFLYGFKDHSRSPFDCPVCQLAMRDSRDHASFVDVKCCYECKESFYYIYRAGWLKGKRPDDEELANYLRNRLSRPSYAII